MYIIKVATFSSSGQGPWFSEFVVKTLCHSVSLLWGKASNISIADVMGDFITTFALYENKLSKMNLQIFCIIM